MILYAARTGTRQNLRALSRLGWRLMVSAKGAWRSEGFRYAIDNGAWTAFQKGEPFDRHAFLGVVSSLGKDADFIVIPDVVAGGRESLAFSRQWIPRLSRERRPLYLAVQDGMTPDDVADVLKAWPEVSGLFVGGSSEWKDQTLPAWAQFAIERGVKIHVGRVNTKRRLDHCQRCGVDSIDGSGPSRFAIHAERMSRWARQKSLVLRSYHATY